MKITKGQVAAVCGLRLAGVPLVACCKMVGAPYKQVRTFLESEWADKIRPRHKWTGERLAKLKRDYLNPMIPTWQAAIRNHTTRDQITHLARREGWPPRKMGRPKGRGKRRIVAKLVNRGMSREQAIYTTLEANHG